MQPEQAALAPRLPQPRGSFSERLFATMTEPHSALPQLQPDSDDDLQISLWALYELHYRGFRDVHADLEWSPPLLERRAALESVFEGQLRALASPLLSETASHTSMVGRLTQIAAHDDGGRPTLASFMQRDATSEQYREFLRQRSLYHLKESDPQSFALARLQGRPKVALAELQYDEYGAGVPARLHSKLFAEAMEAADLDASYAAYVDQASAATLAVNNAMSLFGLHRRLRGACMGHLAAFEMTSSLPCRRIAQGAERLGIGDGVVRYYGEHVEADAVHEHIASRHLCGAMVAEDPGLLPDILLGAATCIALEADSGGSTLADWAAGGTALRHSHAAPAA